MTDAKLKALAERIERLMDERDGIQADIRDIYSEAKGVGYVPKVLRKAITRKRMDASKRDEEDAILDLYESALSPTMRKAVAMAKAGATSREIEQETGVDHATVARSVALNKKSATSPKAPDASSTVTARATESCGPCPVSSADGAEEGSGLPSAKGKATDESPAARRHTSDDALAPALGISQCGDDAPPGPQEPICLECGEPWHGGDCAPLPDAKPRELTPVEIGAVAKPEAERVATTESDDLKFPIFLTKAGQRALPPHKEK